MHAGMDNRPIGMFDSGIGGLTVATALTRIMPHESIIYYGDTVHMPYGEKSAEAIIQYSLRITDHLVRQGCKAILIACNSASSTAYRALLDQVPPGMPVFNVIDPIIRHLAMHHGGHKVGVIGTRATIGSHVYAQRMMEADPTVTIVEKQTALLAAMIEEGFHDNEISEAVIQAYLEDSRFDGITALVPACTHYPLIAGEISSYFGGRVNVLDAPGIVATYVRDILVRKELQADAGSVPAHRFEVSDLTQSFRKSSKMFFGADIDLKEVRLGPLPTA